jgi:hypothetical protein
LPHPSAAPFEVQMTRVLLVGVPAIEHMGGHFLAAAPSAGVMASILDTREAWTGLRLYDRLHYHLRGKRPTALVRFSKRVLATCQALRPDVLLSIGIAPLSAECLHLIGGLGVRRTNFLTDDPWNTSNRAEFFFDSLREYDTVYSPRTANMPDLESHGCADVRVLPFAYNPEQHFPELPATDLERVRFECEVAFIGGADRDRVALMGPLLRAGFKTHLYGGYWDRFPATRSSDRGIVLGRDLRLAVAGGLIHLCMGRAANRDGHAMRSFELPAMGACLIAEDTADHRSLFGPDGECVVYYRQPGEIVELARGLLRDPARRLGLSNALRARVCNGQHTYAARLSSIVRDQ